MSDALNKGQWGDKRCPHGFDGECERRIEKYNDDNYKPGWRVGIWEEKAKPQRQGSND